MKNEAIILGRSFSEWVKEFPIIEKISKCEEAAWLNTKKLPFSEAIKDSPLTARDVKDASDRLRRFASYFKVAFPETAATDGLLESPLKEIPKMKAALEKEYSVNIPSGLMIKLDSHLAVSGSIKARGGIYEVLCVAERIAMKEGGLKESDDYAILADPKFTSLFSKYSIAVGSTGNLGLSIGIISAKLGFKVTVHMSADAREWKKAMLRQKGVTVIENQSDYSVAVENGRREAEKDPLCHFVDDENSKELFLGYSVAAERLKAQLDRMGIAVNEDNPLHVYLPCGVGGGPGGVAFGLKLQFGDNVHCYFAEPTHSPCMMLGMATELHNKVSVNDFGADNRTIADGLAVGRASGFVGKLMLPHTDGCYSISDKRMSSLLRLLCDTEDIRLEPSALAGMIGPVIQNTVRGSIPHGTHLVWETGGSMVPTDELEKYYEAGK